MGIESQQQGDEDEVEGCGTFFDAVSSQNMGKVRELLRWEDKSEAGQSHRKWLVNETTWADWRALHAASESGNLAMVRLMVECGAGLDDVTTSDYTPLHLAASEGHADVTKYLLDLGADVDVYTTASLNGTALHYAAGKGHVECVRHLLNRPDCDVNAMSADYCSSLYYAVLGGHVEICRMLMARGANQTINDVDWNGMAALHNAAQLGLMESVKLLVEEGGADVHLKDKFGRTPADLAKEFAHVHVIDYLNERMKKSTTTTTA